MWDHGREEAIEHSSFAQAMHMQCKFFSQLAFLDVVGVLLLACDRVLHQSLGLALLSNQRV